MKSEAASQPDLMEATNRNSSSQCRWRQDVVKQMKKPPSLSLNSLVTRDKVIKRFKTLRTGRSNGGRVRLRPIA